MILDPRITGCFVDWIAPTSMATAGPNMSRGDQVSSTQPSAPTTCSRKRCRRQPLQPPEQERYFFGGSVYNGWSSVPDK